MDTACPHPPGRDDTACPDTSPGKRELPAAASARALLFYSGFTTIAGEVMLLREVFSALYGSDVALGFALGCWTLFGGVGAWIGTANRNLLKRRSVGWGVAAFFLTLLACFLAARAWGARDVLRFADYARVPLYVGPAAAVGALLFPWILARSRDAVLPAAAYAVETAGGLWAGLAIALYLRIGGRALPLLLLLPAAALVLIVFPLTGRAPPRASFRPLLVPAAACVVALAIAATGILKPLVLQSLKLHYPGYTIVAHENTPSATLTAVRRKGVTFVFENGLPAPSLDTTRDALTILALAAQFPQKWRNVFVLRPVSSGYAEALLHYAGAHVTGWEPDGRKVRFLARTLGENWSGLDLRIEPSPWRVRLQPSDLLLIFSDLPHSLADNRWLTREFFQEAGERLAPGGACITALPAAPGYVHPRREQVIGSIQRAMETAFQHVLRLHTDAGRILLVGLRTTPGTDVLSFHTDRFHRRMRSDVDPGIAAEAADVLLDALLSRSLERPRWVDNAANTFPVNSVFFPAAYYGSLRYRGAMIETARGFWDHVFKRAPRAGWCALAIVLLLSLLSERRCSGAASLFWSSWSATMALAFSLYLCQCVFGEAYWLFALVTAAGMAGVCVGAIRRTTARFHGTLVIAFIPLLFFAWDVLHRLPTTTLIAVILAGNVLIGARVGVVFHRAALSDPHLDRAGGFLFGLDLVGASMGLMLGSVLLPWWMGFRWAGLGVFAAVLVAELALSLRAHRPPRL